MWICGFTIKNDGFTVSVGVYGLQFRVTVKKIRLDSTMTGHWPRYPLTTPLISVQIVNTWNQRFLPKLFARNTLVQWLLKRLSRWENRWCQSYIPNISKSNFVWKCWENQQHRWIIKCSPIVFVCHFGRITPSFVHKKKHSHAHLLPLDQSKNGPSRERLHAAHIPGRSVDQLISQFHGKIHRISTGNPMDMVILKDGSCKSLVHLGVKESYATLRRTLGLWERWSLTEVFTKSHHQSQ